MPKKRKVSDKKKRISEERKVLNELKKQVKAIKNDEKSLKRLEKRLLDQEKKIAREEREILRSEKQIVKTEKKILSEEKNILIAIGRLKITKKHVLDFVKISAGALVGTGLGSEIVSGKSLAQLLPWANVIGIIIIALFLAALLVYQAEKKSLRHMKKPWFYVLKRLVYIWVVATVISGAASLLFATEFLTTTEAVKSLLIGSFPAIAGAIGFNFI